MPGEPDLAPQHATLARAVRLFRLFLVEQSDPNRFYSALAEDSVVQLSGLIPLRNRLVLDVGGGSGCFACALQAAGARYVGIDVDVSQLASTSVATIQGSGTALPVGTSTVDVAHASNVIEHIAEPWRMADEMVRVTRPGGIVYLSFTLWWSPWGGHETSPWHYFGGTYARRRFRRKHGREPKNKFGESLFAYRASTALRWAEGCPNADIVALFPRYHPRWLHWVVHVPMLREIFGWNLVIVLRKRR